MTNLISRPKAVNLVFKMFIGSMTSYSLDVGLSVRSDILGGGGGGFPLPPPLPPPSGVYDPERNNEV